MSWEKMTLDKVADIFSGYAFKSSDMNKHNGTPLLKIKNISNFRVSRDCDTFLNIDFDLSKYSRFLLQKDDFLVAMTGQGSVGRIGKMLDYESGYCVNQRVAIVRVAPHKANPCFIYYQISTSENENELFKKANGAGQPNISAKQIGELEIVLPNIEIQNKIANILSSYDNLIENNQKQIKLLEEAAQRLYKEWFVDLRFPGHENTKIVDGVPEGWRKDRADSLFDITIGKTPPRAESQWFTDFGEGVPWVSISDMGSADTYIFETSESLTDEAVSNHNVKVIPKGTVLLSFKLTVGRVSIVSEDMCTNEAIAHFRIADEKTREYTYCYLKNFHYDSLGSTSSISKAVNSKIVKAMSFVMPDDCLLEKFSDITKPIFEQIYTKQKEAIRLKEARDRLLPKLMSGELEV